MPTSSLRAKKILAPKLPIDDLNAALKLNDGVLSFTPATFGVANGRMEIYSTFDGSKRPSKVQIDARMRQLDLKRFLGRDLICAKNFGPDRRAHHAHRDRRIFPRAHGNGHRQYFSCYGRRGKLAACSSNWPGWTSPNRLSFLVRGDKSIPVRCGLIDLEANDGQMAVKTLVFDTEDSVIYGEGNIDLRDEKLNIVVLPVPKDFSPLSLRSYIRARGPLNNVSVFPDPIKTGTDSHDQEDFQRFDHTRYDPLSAPRLGSGQRRRL